MAEKKLLLTEKREIIPLDLVKENIAGKGQNYYLCGIYSEADKKNQNGRIYPANVLIPETEKFITKYVNENRALGEADHPESSTINIDRVSHRVVNLTIEGKTVYGKSIIGGPMGDAIKSILDMGGKLGVSSRSLGNVDYRNYVTDLQLITWDIVHEPSVSAALMTNIIESKKFDWMKDESGFVTESLKKDFQIINSNRLLSESEKNVYIELLFKRFFKKLLK